jgi:hypothetical protein
MSENAILRREWERLPKGKKVQDTARDHAWRFFRLTQMIVFLLAEAASWF